jgi:hypothetical protein
MYRDAQDTKKIQTKAPRAHRLLSLFSFDI